MNRDTRARLSHRKVPRPAHLVARSHCQHRGLPHVAGAKLEVSACVSDGVHGCCLGDCAGNLCVSAASLRHHTGVLGANLEVHHAAVSKARSVDVHLGPALEGANSWAGPGQGESDHDATYCRVVRIAIVLGGNYCLVFTVWKRRKYACDLSGYPGDNSTLFSSNCDLVKDTLIVK